MEDEEVEYLGARELQALMATKKISRQRVYQIAKRPDFPRPWAKLKQGQVWLGSEVREWIDIHRTKSP